MFSDRRAAAFEDCLQRVLDGASLEQALAGYPELADELRPMLQAALAARLQGQRLLAPRSALARSRARFLREAQRRSSARRPDFGFSLRFALAAFILLAVVVLGSAATAVLAAQSLPGQALYPLKRLGEQTRLRLVSDPQRRLELQQDFDQERLKEVDQLIQEQRSVPVNFVGVLKAAGEGDWLVGDVVVQVSPQTRLEGELQVGFYVSVEGETRADGSVIAAHIWDRAAVFTGELQQMAEDRWLVSGVEIMILPQTRLNGTPAVGSRLEMVLVQAESGQWAARAVVVRTPGPQPTAQPVKPQPTARPTRLAPPTRTPESVQPRPTRTPEPSETPKPTEDEEEPRETVRPSRTPKPSETQNPSKTPEPSESPEPTEDEEEEEEEEHPSPTPSMTPTPSKTPRPSRTPDDDDDD